MEVPFPYITYIEGYCLVDYVPGGYTAQITVSHKGRTFSLRNGQIVENVTPNSGSTVFSMMLGNLPANPVSIGASGNDLYMLAGGNHYIVWLSFYPQVTQTTFQFAHPGQILLQDPAQESDVILNRGSGFYVANILFGIVPFTKRAVADRIETFFFSLDQQANWVHLPLYHQPATGLGTGVAVTSRQTNSAGFIELTLASNPSLAVDQWVSDGERVYKIFSVASINAGANAVIVLLPQKTVAPATVLYPARTVRARSASNRPVNTRRVSDGWGGWVWGWRENVS